MRRRHAQTTLAIVAVMILSSCAAAPTPAGPGATTVASPQPVPSATLAAAPPSTTASAACPGLSEPLLHQAPELEGLLPSSVGGRELARWSVLGRCWPALLLEDGPAAVDDFVIGFETPGGEPMNLDNLAYAVAGRADTSADPPYFVWIAKRPYDDDEISLTLVLLFGGAGYHDVAAGIDPQNYQLQTIAGREVNVGTEAMLKQDDHQRGRPYFFETEQHMYLLVTEDEAWAADAIAQLP
jgi:hypothetical protein